jgi:hypothetical protein
MTFEELLKVVEVGDLIDFKDNVGFTTPMGFAIVLSNKIPFDIYWLDTKYAETIESLADEMESFKESSWEIVSK